MSRAVSTLSRTHLTTSLSVRDPLVEFGLNVPQPETCRHVAQQPAQVGVRTRQRHSAIAAIESQFAREELLRRSVSNCRSPSTVA